MQAFRGICLPEPQQYQKAVPETDDGTARCFSYLAVTVCWSWLLWCSCGAATAQELAFWGSVMDDCVAGAIVLFQGVPHDAKELQQQHCGNGQLVTNAC